MMTSVFFGSFFRTLSKKDMASFGLFVSLRATPNRMAASKSVGLILRAFLKQSLASSYFSSSNREFPLLQSVSTSSCFIFNALSKQRMAFYDFLVQRIQSLCYLESLDHMEKFSRLH